VLSTGSGGSDPADRRNVPHRGVAAPNRAHQAARRRTGGIFDSGEPKPEQDLDGTIELVFEGCNSTTPSHDIPSSNRSGTIPITRVEPDNVAACEEDTTR
jgi:hypothetical protein